MFWAHGIATECRFGDTAPVKACGLGEAAPHGEERLTSGRGGVGGPTIWGLPGLALPLAKGGTTWFWLGNGISYTEAGTCIPGPTVMSVSCESMLFLWAVVQYESMLAPRRRMGTLFPNWSSVPCMVLSTPGIERLGALERAGESDTSDATAGQLSPDGGCPATQVPGASKRNGEGVASGAEGNDTPDEERTEEASMSGAPWLSRLS